MNRVERAAGLRTEVFEVEQFRLILGWSGKAATSGPTLTCLIEKPQIAPV